MVHLKHLVHLVQLSLFKSIFFMIQQASRKAELVLKEEQDKYLITTDDRGTAFTEGKGGKKDGANQNRESKKRGQ